MAVATVTAPTAHWSSIRGRASGLAGMSGCMELYVSGAPAGLMLVEENGDVWIGKDGKAVALIDVDSPETMLELLRGDLPPVVAHLQGRLRFEGDAALALRVLFGLQENSPWATLPKRRPA